MIIRKMKVEDIEQYIALAGQLGYEADRAHLLACINAPELSEAVFAAEENERIIGWVDSRISQSFLSKPYGEIVGFVVDEKQRSAGVGSMLLQEAERWLKKKGVSKVIVHSNVKRLRAHEFYFKNGYSDIKEQKLLWKEL